MDFIDFRLATADDPRDFGKPLRGDMRGLWRYRVGDYRLICQIQDQLLLVLILEVGNRRNIYR